jgi:hypothetical protein
MNEPINPYAAPQTEISLPPQTESVDYPHLPGLRTTGIGLSLIYYGILLILLIYVGVVPVGALLSLGSGPGQGSSANTMSSFVLMMIITGGIAVLGGLLYFAGQLVCVSVPKETGARGFVTASVILSLGSVLSLFVRVPVSFALESMSIIAIFLITRFSGIASIFFFVLFLRKLSAFLGRKDFMIRARNLLILGAILLGVLGALFIAKFSRQETFGILGIVLVLGGLIAFVMYANLINALRKVLLGKEPRRKKPGLLGREIG